MAYALHIEKCSPECFTQVKDILLHTVGWVDATLVGMFKWYVHQGDNIDITSTCIGTLKDALGRDGAESHMSIYRRVSWLTQE